MQSIDSLRELNSKLLAEIAKLRKENDELKDKNNEIPDLRRKFAELEAEKAELKGRIAELLRQAVEESKRRDVENAKLKARIEELEKNKTVTTKLESENAEFRDRITKVEQKQMLSNNVSKVTNSSNNSSSNFNSLANQLPMEMDTSLPEEPIPEGSLELSVPAVNIPVIDQCDQTSLEDKETDAFLNEVHKKKVSDEIRQRNREKKLLHESANHEASSISQDISSVKGHDDRSSSENLEKNGNSITNHDDWQKIIPVIADDDDDVTELSKNQNIEQELTKESLSGSITVLSLSSETTKHPSSSLDTTQSLVHLFQNTIRVEHKVIFSWLYYSNSFENKVDEIRYNTGTSDKTARSQIYKEILEHLPDITLGNLHMRTLQAKKIRMLFGEGGVGIDKIKKVTFSVYDILSLTINQIQSVIKNVTLAGRTLEVPNRNHVTSITNCDDQINVTTIYDRTYFCNKTLDQYPNLYKEYSSEDFGYYGITNKTLCPLCKLSHDDEESIEELIYVNYTYYKLN
ncbi:hypothetical protein GLOIN_2v1778212 [Rhizophagus clarus]|uniref:Uncharacterized protein n=1 Tax=Rhizophagus clarus TaxID=94130 RepID=A0A8H3M0S7_9GLOM|nr:hypothetical protein GLOIN_2v1778212 [Rhizophagus clarus]